MKDQRQNLAILLVLFLTTINGAAKAATYYDFQITEGLIETSGGFSGGGYGSFDLTGSFGMTFTDTTMSFSNVSVSSSTLTFFEFPTFDGQFDNGNISGDTGPYTNAEGRVTYSGYFSGNTLTLSGTDLAPCCDQYNHSFELTATTPNASPVPLPASFWLLFSSLGILRFFKSRRNT